MGEHYYGKNGEERYDATMKEVRKENLRPSVTTVLGVLNKIGLNIWKEDRIYRRMIEKAPEYLVGAELIEAVKKEIKEELNRSAEEGTKIHKQVADFFMHKSPIELQLLESLVGLVHDYAIDALEVEKAFSSEVLGYGGKVDMICLFGGVETIIDWKTKETEGKKTVPLYDEVPMQLAACAYGVGRPKAKLCTIVISRDEPGRILEPKFWDHNEQYFEAFQAAHTLWCATKNYNPFTGGKWYV